MTPLTASADRAAPDRAVADPEVADRAEVGRDAPAAMTVTVPKVADAAAPPEPSGSAASGGAASGGAASGGAASGGAASGGAAADPAPPRQPERIKLWAVVATRVLAVIAIGSLGFVAYLLVISPIQHERSQALLRARLNEQLAAQTAPTGSEIAPGSPVARLRIPRLGVDEVVVSGTAGGDLASGPGHRRAGPLPGQPGTAVVYGRAVAFGAPFRHLPRLRPGDPVLATTGQGDFVYRVDAVRRAKDPVPPAPEAGQARLTLVTMEGDGWLRPSETVYLDATMASGAQPAEGVRTRIQLADEAPLARDSTELIGLVLWLQALIVAAAAWTWARLRWGRRETWIVGLPVILALTVLVYRAAAVALLPNLM